MKRTTKAEVLEWFKLAHDPFGQLQGEGDLVSSLDLQAAVHLLDYAARHGEAVALLGEWGAGKTTLVSAALARLPEVVLPIHFHADKAGATIGQVVETCLVELGVEPLPRNEVRRRKVLREQWLALRRESPARRPMLIVDEAHRLRGSTVKALKELHEQSRPPTLGANLFSMLFVGHRHLTALYRLQARDLLARLEAENILVLGEMIPLAAHRYVLHRLSAAGGAHLLPEETARRIAARATPLELNRRMWAALVAAYAAGSETITAGALAEAGLLAPAPLAEPPDAAGTLSTTLSRLGGQDAEDSATEGAAASTRAG